MVIDILVWKMDASGRFFQIDSKATPRQFLRCYFLKLSRCLYKTLLWWRSDSAFTY